MKIKFVAWLFFITCNIALSSSATENVMRGEEAHGVNETTGFCGKVFEEKCELMFDLNKAQGGKGSYGGANIVHRPGPNQQKADASSLARPSFSLSATIAYVSFSLLPVFDF